MSANTLNRGAAYIYDAPLDPVDELLRRAQRYPVLPHERVIELAQRIERGDLEAKDLLINSNLRLVVSVARKYQGQGLSFADLVQEGMLGLIRAAEKFDWRKGYRFSTYATIWIRQALQRGLDNTGRTVRLPAHISQRVRRLGRAERELARQLGEEPSLDELADGAGLRTSTRSSGWARYQQVLASLDAGVGEDGETPLGALLPIDEVPLEEQAIRGETSRLVQAGCLDLPDGGDAGGRRPLRDRRRGRADRRADGPPSRHVGRRDASDRGARPPASGALPACSASAKRPRVTVVARGAGSRSRAA